MENICEQLTFFAIDESVSEPSSNNSIVYDVAEVSANDRFSKKINHVITGSSVSLTPREKYACNINAIRLLKQIESEDRLAAADEYAVLSQYIGWGSMPQVFDENNSGWSKEYNELKSLLTDEEYEHARASVLNAFYTTPGIVKAIYKTLVSFGIAKGNALEPSFGIGNFLGLVPGSMKDVKFYGTELDPVTARIAKLLYPLFNLHHTGFENAPFTDAFFDFAVGNVPFGGYKIIDKRYDKLNLFIHDYFFAKTLDLLRPGGVMAYVTSKGTLDKKNPAFRKYLAQRADFLGAVRLPNIAFKDYAGTEVTSDIIFLQKRESLCFDDAAWIESIPDKNNGIYYNRYFHENPHMMLGNMGIDSGHRMYGSETVSYCFPFYPPHELYDRLDKALSNISCNYYENTIDDIEGEIGESIPADDTVKNFSYAINKGRLYFRENSIMVPVVLPQATKERIAGMISLRDCLTKLIDMQLNSSPEKDISSQQSRLNYLYNKFVGNHGLINSSANAKAFSKDSSYYLICSLEIFDEDGEFDRKADIFTSRTINRKSVYFKADTSSEALSISMSEKGRPDLDYMSALTGFDKEKLLSDLKGILFLDPGTNKKPEVPEGENPDEYLFKDYELYEAVTADEYLSGNVRHKLHVAKAFNNFIDGEPQFDFSENIKALEKVQPVDLQAHEIYVTLGSSWINPKYIEEFMWQLLETPDYMRDSKRVVYFKNTATWNVAAKNSYLHRDILATVTYGTERANAYRIIDDTLNLRDVRIYDTVRDEFNNEKRVLNKKETMLACQKQELIKNKFKDWIFADPDRRDALVREYNLLFNSIRPREYDGSHVDLGGMSPSITLNPHQTAAVARILYGGNTLLAHEVGAGKTFVMAAAVMESRRLGLCNKAMMVVPNHITEQIASEFLRLYPSANVLVATARDFEAKNRKKLCARIATGDYDCVIIGHSQLYKIPVSKERMIMTIRKEIDEIVFNLKQVKEARGERFTVKQLEKSKKSLDAKLKKLNDDNGKDDIVTFEQLGIDRLFIDESHYFKNLYIITKMRNVAGLSVEDAQKTADLFMKTKYLDEITNNRGVIFATGTPISNSMSEMYSLQRYLQYSMLEQCGLSCFDSWASSFTETTTSMELAPEGNSYRARTRFSKFNNLPELMNMFKECADIKTSDMLNLPKPNAVFETIVAKPTDLQRDLVKELSVRAKAVSERRVKPTEDNMLKITTDGRKIGLDQRLIDPSYPDDPNSKVNLCFKNVLRIYEEGSYNKLTQIVFCDFSTPGKDKFNVYDDIKDKLIAAGVPENEIAFIHDADTDVKKKALFGKIRTGKVRILMGSTQKCGAGTNIQDKLIAIHDLDCPWRPSDLAQRAGRIIRQGNGNETVYIYRYVTDATFDAYLFQTLEKKQEFISQIMTSKAPVRACEDIDEDTLSYAEIKSLCAGNPLIKEKMELDVKVSKLKLLKSDYLSNQYRLEDSIIKEFPKNIKAAESLLSLITLDVKALSEYDSPLDDEGNPVLSIDILGKTYDERKKAGFAILEECQFHDKSKITELGSYKGFSLYLKYNNLNAEHVIDLKLNSTYSVSAGADPVGVIQRIENLVAKIPEKLETQQKTVSNLHQQFENAKLEFGKPFDKEEELETANKRLTELNFMLTNDVSDETVVKDDNSDILYIPEFEDENAA